MGVITPLRRGKVHKMKCFDGERSTKLLSSLPLVLGTILALRASLTSVTLVSPAAWEKTTVPSVNKAYWIWISKFSLLVFGLFCSTLVTLSIIQRKLKEV